MKDNLHEYKKSEEQQANNTIEKLQRDIGDLLGLYKQWKRKYAGLFDSIEQYFAITRFYEKLLSDLKDAKKEMKGVYNNAWEAERKLVRTLEAGKNQVHYLNLRTKALRDMICNNPKCFDSPNFADQLKKVEEITREEEYNEILKTYQENGKWKELLAKDGSLITEIESMALAKIFLSLDNTGMAEFLRLCYGLKTLYSDGMSTGMAVIMRQGNPEKPDYPIEDFYYCELDNVKVQMLNESMAKRVSMNEQCYLEAVDIYNNPQEGIPPITLDEIYDIKKQRDDMLQKAGILQAISKNNNIVSVYGAPIFTVDKEAEINGGEYIIEYTNYKVLSKTEGWDTAIRVENNSSVVTRPHEGISNNWKITEDKKKEFEFKYGMSANINDIGEDAIKGYARDKVIEKLAEKTKELIVKGGGSKFIGLVPIAGDAVSLLIDVGIDYAELQEKISLEKQKIDRDQAANYASALKLSCVYIDYTDYDIKASVLTQPTAETYDAIDRYNEFANLYNFTQIDKSYVLNRAEYTYDLLNEMFNENLTLFNMIFSSTLPPPKKGE